jgi:cytochrome c-type biogenesis protein CcmH
MTTTSGPTTRPTRPARSFLVTWGPWLAMVIVVAVALFVGTFGATRPLTNADRLLNVSRTIKCPQCSGESVAESNAAVSQQIRIDIAKRIEQGQTDDQIRQAYVDQYDEYILLTPRSTGVTSLVWILPVVMLVLAFAGLAVVFQRWKVRGDVHATDADRALVGLALAADAGGPDAGRVAEGGHADDGDRADDGEMGAGR